MSLFLQYAHFISQQAPIPPNWLGMGATPRYPDGRDRHVLQIPEVLAWLPRLPPSVDRTEYLSTPYNQGSEYSCVSYSWCGACSIDQKQTTGRWPIYDGHGLYATLGGHGRDGIDSRACANYIIKNGTPLLSGGSERVIGSYANVTQAPQTFRQQIFACIAAQQSVKLALLLPTDWGWGSGHGQVTQGYHEVVPVGYVMGRVASEDYYVVFNSWGPWGKDGRGIGSVVCDYCEANGNQNGLCYAETTTSLVLPPPPPPPPIQSALVTAQATGAGVPSLAAGQVYSLSRSVSVSLTDVKFDQQPPPPPPNPLAVTGYSPNPVRGGDSFTIQGQGFSGGNLTVSWAGQSLVAQTLGDTQIQATAPSVGSTASAAVTVRVEAATADGPPLTVTAGDVTPGQLKVTVLARRYTRGIVGVWAYVQEPGSPDLDVVLGGTDEVIVPPTVLNPEAGGYVAASVSCRIVSGGQGISLEAHPAQANGTPAVWQISGAPPAPATVTAFATAADGRTGSAAVQV